MKIKIEIYCILKLNMYIGQWDLDKPVDVVLMIYVIIRWILGKWIIIFSYLCTLKSNLIENNNPLDLTSGIYLIILICKHKKEVYADVLKYIQLFSMLVWFMNDFITLTANYFDQDIIISNFMIFIVVITNPYFLWFSIDQYSWYIFTQHLNK